MSEQTTGDNKRRVTPQQIAERFDREDRLDLYELDTCEYIQLYELYKRRYQGNPNRASKERLLFIEDAIFGDIEFNDDEHPLKPTPIELESVVSSRLERVMHAASDRLGGDEALRYEVEGKRGGYGSRWVRSKVKSPSKIKRTDAIEIARATGVTVDYLQGKSDNQDEHEKHLSPDVVRKAYEFLQPRYRERVTDCIRGIVIEQILNDSKVYRTGELSQRQLEIAHLVKAVEFLIMCLNLQETANELDVFRYFCPQPEPNEGESEK